jgi:hypothetical protein
MLLPNWHKPYADLLLETDAVKLPALISRAKREIVNRYLERSLFPITREEYLDLRNATIVLRHSRNSNQ